MQERASKLLSLAVTGMAGYALYSAGLGLFDVLLAHRLDLWADVALVLGGLALGAAAVLVRLQVPGGLALALGAMLALQGLALHNDLHWYGHISVASQAGRGVFALTLAVLAHAGDRTSAAEAAEAGTGGRGAGGSQ